MAKRKAGPDDPGHKMGQRCGYTLMADGRILPAPNYSDKFHKLSNERRGINDLMKLFTSHCADLLAEIGRQQEELWNDVCDDYGMNKETHEIFFDGTYLCAKPKQPTSADSAGEQHG